MDEEWPVTMKAALGRLWGMYQESSSGRIDDRVENARLLQELASEKKKFEKKYSSLMSDVNKFIDDMVKRAEKENYRRIMSGEVDDLDEMKKKVELLQTEVAELKQIQISQAAVMKAKQKAWDVEREDLKKEKKVQLLQTEVAELKQVQKSEAAVMKEKQEAWDVEREGLKQEKKRLEYAMFDLFKASAANKEKMKRIKAICEEL